MVLLLFVLYTVNCIDRMSLSVGMPSIVHEFHLSATMQGLILSAFFWTYSTFQIPAGVAADRFGARRMIGISAALWGGFQCLAGFAVNGLTLLLTRIGLGVFEAPYMPAATKLTGHNLNGSILALLLLVVGDTVVKIGLLDRRQQGTMAIAAVLLLARGRVRLMRARGFL